MSTDDWVERPLDLLLGYDPTKPMPTVKRRIDRPWHPEDAVPRLRETLDAHTLWVLVHERGLKWQFANFRAAKTERNDKLMRDARKLTRKLLDEGRLVLPTELLNEDATRAEEALTYIVAVVKNAQEDTKHRLVAAKTLLDFTKTKPATKSDVTVKRAEDFLDGLDG